MTTRKDLLSKFSQMNEGWLPDVGKVYTITLEEQEREALMKLLLPEGRIDAEALKVLARYDVNAYVDQSGDYDPSAYTERDPHPYGEWVLWEDIQRLIDGEPQAPSTTEITMHPDDRSGNLPTTSTPRVDDYLRGRPGVAFSGLANLARQLERELAEAKSARPEERHTYSEKPVAWLIVRHSGTGGASAQHLEVVLSPLTDDTYMDEGDEAWPLYSRLTPSPQSGGKPE